MPLDFDVTDPAYVKALEEVRKISLPKEYWDSVVQLIETEGVKQKELEAIQKRADHELWKTEHRPFTL